ncbi:MAG TPA: hypothetical protein VHG70_02130, partial [Nocardioidaceae bacterium]|nr:hypothetical protein [Nocardioidaceae bacterium]
HGPHQVKQPFPGIYLWRDSHARIYLLDHTGTRKLGNTQRATPTPDITIDVYTDDPDVDICYQPHHVA